MTPLASDPFILGGHAFTSRLLTGTGKYSSSALIPQIIDATQSEMMTVALRRVDPTRSDSILSHIPRGVTVLPNTSGARTADEAVRLARIARSAGCGDFVKIEVVVDERYLMPDNAETLAATRTLVQEGFLVLPYISPDPVVARQLEEAGAAAVMPLGAPIGSNRGLRTRELLRIIIEQAQIPVIIDAGLGAPSHAAEAMEMGASAVLVNTGIASANDPVGMARAFRLAVEAGRLAYISGSGSCSIEAQASSPLTGFLR